MKILALFLISASCLAFMDSQFWPLDQAEKTWGIAPFSSEKFRTENSVARAPMALDMIKHGRYIGEKFQRIVKELGKPDAQFDGHRYPAYRIGGGKTAVGILVFLPDFTEQRVEEVRIAKATKPSDIAIPPSGTVVGSKLLPVEIQGESAKAIFEQMSSVKDEQGKKTGVNISCESTPDYRCSFVVDEEGHSTSH